MRLYCTNLDCEHTCPDYESGGPYQAPECPKCCWSPMEPLGERLDPRRHELDRAEAQRIEAEDRWYAQRKAADSVPAEQYAMPVGAMRVRQAS